MGIPVIGGVTLWKMRYLRTRDLGIFTAYRLVFAAVVAIALATR